MIPCLIQNPLILKIILVFILNFFENVLNSVLSELTIGSDLWNNYQRGLHGRFEATGTLGVAAAVLVDARRAKMLLSPA